jgi:hypothetical protein
VIYLVFIETLCTLVSAHIIDFHRHMMTKFPSGLVVGGHGFGLKLEEDDDYWKELFSNQCVYCYCTLGCSSTWLRTQGYDFDMLPRASIWSCDLPPAPTISALASSSPVYVPTAFNPRLPINRTLPNELQNGDTGTKPWTQAQWVLAKQALWPTSIEEFDKLVSFNSWCMRY